MRKQLLALTLICLTWFVSGCTSPTSGLKAFVDSIDGYEFLYPNGWLPVEVASGVDVVFRDLIQTTENVSVVVSPLNQQKTLAELGDPDEVGQRLAKRVIAPPESGREAELVAAERRDVGDKTYYNIEYLVRLPASTAATHAPADDSLYQRHTLTSVAVSRGKLYTLSVSAPEKRWPKVQTLFELMSKSFTVY
jgi:photosystem II oxygen-evolving enhancer protein 2